MPPFGNEFLAVLNNSLSDLSTLSLENVSVPIRPGIQNCYPNPFNPSVTINFELSNQNYTNISVYNLLGERIDKLVSDNFYAGSYSIKWDASAFPTGVYFLKLTKSRCISMFDFFNCSITFCKSSIFFAVTLNCSP